MTKPEPLRGSLHPAGSPARLLGDDEVDTLLAMQDPSEDAPDEETDDDRRRD